eukprot:TRINITY_DN1877_c0_g1_i1.p1 TRINITY_DN1877_c0_g1~~TRINITY_DN1877_c0_g1_i1.p1  ORF type:complete len:919 (+),score=243.61 TRINITY_DN1877_c0_g1_i1:95-2851(+)
MPSPAEKMVASPKEPLNSPGRAKAVGFVGEEPPGKRTSPAAHESHAERRSPAEAGAAGAPRGESPPLQVNLALLRSPPTSPRQPSEEHASPAAQGGPRPEARSPGAQQPALRTPHEHGQRGLMGGEGLTLSWSQFDGGAAEAHPGDTVIRPPHGYTRQHARPRTQPNTPFVEGATPSDLYAYGQGFAPLATSPLEFVSRAAAAAAAQQQPRRASVGAAAAGMPKRTPRPHALTPSAEMRIPREAFSYGHGMAPLATSPLEFSAGWYVDPSTTLHSMLGRRRQTAASMPATPYEKRLQDLRDEEDEDGDSTVPGQSAHKMTPPFVSVVLNGMESLQVILPDEDADPVAEVEQSTLLVTSVPTSVQVVATMPSVFVPDKLKWKVTVSFKTPKGCVEAPLGVISIYRCDAVTEVTLNEQPNRVVLRAEREPYEEEDQGDLEEESLIAFLKTVFNNPDINPRGGSLALGVLSKHAREKAPDTLQSVLDGEAYEGSLEKFLREHSDTFFVYNLRSKEIESRGLGDCCEPEQTRVALTLHERQGCKAVDCVEPEGKQRDVEKRLLARMEQLLSERDYEQRDLLDQLAQVPEFLFCLSPSFSTLMRFLSKHKDKFAWTTHPDLPTRIGLASELKPRPGDGGKWRGGNSSQGKGRKEAAQNSPQEDRPGQRHPLPTPAQQSPDTQNSGGTDHFQQRSQGSKKAKGGRGGRGQQQQRPQQSPQQTQQPRGHRQQRQHAQQAQPPPTRLQSPPPDGLAPSAPAAGLAAASAPPAALHSPYGGSAPPLAQPHPHAQQQQQQPMLAFPQVQLPVGGVHTSAAAAQAQPPQPVMVFAVPQQGVSPTVETVPQGMFLPGTGVAHAHAQVQALQAQQQPVGFLPAAGLPQAQQVFMALANPMAQQQAQPADMAAAYMTAYRQGFVHGQQNQFA